jgi:hypothetical protein
MKIVGTIAFVLTAAIAFAQIPEGTVSPPTGIIFPGGSKTWPEAAGGGASNPYSDAILLLTFNDPSNLGEDTSGGGNDFSLVNTPTASGGATGYSAAFDNTSTQYAVGGDSPDIADEDHAICAWGRFTINGVIACKGDNGTRGAPCLDTFAGIRFYFNNTGTPNATKPFTQNQRHFACGWWDASTDTIFADVDNSGSPGSSTHANNPVVNDENFAVSAFNNGFNPLTMEAGPIMIWQGSFPSAATMGTLYNSGKGKLCGDLSGAELTNLVHCWDMIEAGGPYSDSVGSNPLTAVNTPTRQAGLVELPVTSGMSAHTDGSSSYFSLASATAIRGSATTGFWVSFWLNQTYDASSVAYSALWGTTGVSILLRNTFHSCTLFDDGGVGNTINLTPSTITDGEWALVNCYWDPATGLGTFTWYDSDETLSDDSASTFTFEPQAAGREARVSNAGGNSINGSLDTVAIWDRPPAAGEIATIWNSGAGTFP